MNFAPWVYIAGSLVAHAIGLAFAVLLVRRTKDATSRRQGLRKVGWAGVALWTLGGLLWSEWGRPFPRLALMLIPQWLTTWPAHEAALVVTGHGLGANMRTSLVPTAICAVVWSLILWAPLLTTKSRAVSVRAAVVLEVLLMIVVAALYWKYGNG